MSADSRPRRYRVDLLPLALLAILATTAIPLELRPAVGWNGDFNTTDIAENLLLYVPLGVALWRWRPSTVFAAALVLSLFIEVLQMWQIGRFASPVDVAMNALGALLGAMAWQRLARSSGLLADRPLIRRRWLTVAAIMLVGLAANWMFPLRSAALAEWSPDFALLLGNELTGDRPWSGAINELALLPRTLSGNEMQALHATGRLPAGAAYVLPQAVRLDGQRMRLPEDVARDLADSVMRANALTIVVRFAPENVFQEGPARIVSFSVDPYRRNFDLGQDGRRLVFRIFTPVSGRDANRVTTRSDWVLEPGREILVVASYDGGVARIHANGALIGRSNFVAETCTLPALCNSTLPAAWTLFGALLAIVSLAFVPWRLPARAVAISLVAGAIAIAFSSLLPDHGAVWFQPWTPWLALIGAGTVGIAARAEPS